MDEFNQFIDKWGPRFILIVMGVLGLLGTIGMSLILLILIKDAYLHLMGG